MESGKAALSSRRADSDYWPTVCLPRVPRTRGRQPRNNKLEFNVHSVVRSHPWFIWRGKGDCPWLCPWIKGSSGRKGRVLAPVSRDRYWSLDAGIVKGQVEFQRDLDVPPWWSPESNSKDTQILLSLIGSSAANPRSPDGKAVCRYLEELMCSLRLICCGFREVTQSKVIKLCLRVTATWWTPSSGSDNSRRLNQRWLICWVRTDERTSPRDLQGRKVRVYTPHLPLSPWERTAELVLPIPPGKERPKCTAQVENC